MELKVFDGVGCGLWVVGGGVYLKDLVCCIFKAGAASCVGRVR